MIDKKKEVPAPGTYTLKNTLSNLAYSIRPRTNLSDDNVRNKAPGPGAYNVFPLINEKGKYPVSKYKGSGASVFNPATS